MLILSVYRAVTVYHRPIASQPPVIDVWGSQPPKYPLLDKITNKPILVISNDLLLPHSRIGRNADSVSV
jgi:hypothetical protein